MRNSSSTGKNARTRLNEAISAPQLRVVDAEGAQLGVMSKAEALAQARAVGLDLVEISPNANPPVVKIIDWGKYSYKKTKEEKKNRLKNKTDLKQIRFGLKIGQHDLDIKLRKAREFLTEGNTVRFIVRYKGREMAHRDIGFTLLDRIVESLEDIASVEQQATMAGRQLSMSMRYQANAKAKNTQRSQEADPRDQDREDPTP